MNAIRNFGTYELMMQQMTEQANEEHRRCRIVNVRRKAQKVPKDRKGYLERLWQPDPSYPGIFSLPPMYEACHGCIGKICGNVACPSRPVVTCSVQPLGKEFEAAIYSDVEALKSSTPSLSNGGA